MFGSIMVSSPSYLQHVVLALLGAFVHKVLHDRQEDMHNGRLRQRCACSRTNAALHAIRHRCSGPQISRDCSAHLQRHPPSPQQNKR
jgi:hypothetical protein